MEGESHDNAITETISLNSKIATVNTRFHIHEIIKKSKFSTHCVAEDLEVDPASTNVIMYYFLKQNVYNNEAEYQYALTYYQKLQSYCKQPLAKADIIKLYTIFHFEDSANNHFELVLLFELGEADRIDIDQIQIQQITKFLKNVCILLQDLKSKVDLYEGNICIKNIVLTENELKISGFKPLFVNNPEYQTWKIDLCKKYSPYRLDLYMIGLIWLRMLGSNVEEVTKTARTVDEVSTKITQQYEGLPEEKKTNIVAQFLDLKNRPNLNLDDAILLFDEYFIIETRKLMELQKISNKHSSNSKEFDGGSISEDGRGSIGQSNFDSNMKEQNLFTKGLNDSGIDAMTFKNEEVERKVTEGSFERSRNETEFSMNDAHSFVPDKNYSVGNLIEVHDQQKPEKRQSEIVPTNRESGMSLQKKNLMSGSEKRMSKPSQNKDGSIASFKNEDSYGTMPANEQKELFDADGNPMPNSSHQVNKATRLSAPVEEIEKHSGKQSSLTSFTKKTTTVEVEEEKRTSTKTESQHSKQNSKIEMDQKRQSKESLSSKKNTNQVDSTIKESTNNTKESLVQSKRGDTSTNVVKAGSINKDSFVEMPIDSDKNLPDKELNDKIDKVATYMSPKGSVAQKKSQNNDTESKQKSTVADNKETLSQKKSSELANVPRSKLSTKDKLVNLNRHLETISLPLNYTDHERNVGLHIKKSSPIVTMPMELSDEQRERIQREIEAEHQKKLQLDREKQERDKLLIEQKHSANLSEQEKLRERIETILEKKLSEKKATLNNPPPEHEKTQGLSKKNEQSPEVKPFNQSLPIKNVIKTKKQAPVWKQKQNPQFSNFQQKDELFTYNSDLQNKNITFRKVVTKLDAFSKTSRSPSPHMTKKGPNVFENSFTRPLDANVGADAPVSPNQTNNLVPTQNKTFNSVNPNVQVTENLLLNDNYKASPLPANKYPFEKDWFFVFNKLDNLGLKNDNSQRDVQAQEAVSRFIKEKKDDMAIEYINEKKSMLSPGCLIKLYHDLFNSADARKDQNAIKRILIELYDSATSSQNLKVDDPLLQELAMSLANLEICNNNFNNASKILQSSIFDGPIADLVTYEGLIIKSLNSLGKNVDLADHYEKQIDKNIADSFQHLDIAKLFVNISQVLECLNSTNENAKIVKFYNKVITVLQRIKKLNANLKLKEHDYENLIECFVLNTLRFANKNRNFNLSNFVIGESIKNKHVDFVRNFIEDERKEYAALILEFCWHLKDLPNYGTYKDNYIKDLTHSKDVLKNCDLNSENLKTSLVINFNRGVFYLKEENYKKAQALFDKCLITYYAFFKEADQDLYVVLFNLGMTLYGKDKFPEAIYFFNRVLDEQCKNNDLKERSLKKLGFIFFFMEQFKKAIAMFQGYLDSNFVKRTPKDFYKCLSVYFICCERTDSDEFSKFFKRLPQLSANDLDQELFWYFKTFKSIQKIYEEHHNYKENKGYLQLIEEVIASPQGNTLSAKRLLNIGGLMFHKFVDVSSEKVKNPSESLVKSFHDFYLTIEENSICLAKYINNLLLIILHTMPLFNERTHNHEYRQITHKKIRKTVPKAILVEVISGLARTNASKKENIPDSLFRELQPENSSPEKFGRLQKLPSEQILGSPKLDVNDCICMAEFKKNPDMQQLVKLFLKQIKNMLFLDIIENIFTYYLRFEKSLLELNLNYQKYNYIKQLIRFHLSKEHNAAIDRTAFVALLDQLFSAHNICIHDLKLIIVLLEGLKDVTYLKLFCLYLDQYHVSHASIVFKSEFYDQFMRKSEGVTDKFFQQINAFKYYELENCYFMHHLESHNFINIDKQFSFKLFLRSRHDLLNDPQFRDLFAKYVQPEDLQIFDLKYYIYRTIVKLLKKNDEAPIDILMDFQTKFLDALTKMGSDEGKMFALVYEVLLLCNLYKFDSQVQPIDVFINVMGFIIKKFHFNLNFQFSRVLSLMGNIFFKYGHVAKCLDMKKQALALMNEDSRVNLQEPAFMTVENKELHLYHVFSFIVACYLEMNDFDTAISVFEKMEKINTSDQNVKFNKLILKSLVFLALDKLPESLKTIFDAITMFGKMKLNDYLNKIYQAILDKVTLMVISKTENEEELEVIQKKSKQSISKLYESQI